MCELLLVSYTINRVNIITFKVCSSSCLFSIFYFL